MGRNSKKRREDKKRRATKKTPMRRAPQQADVEERRAEAKKIIDSILHGVPEGRVAPEIAEDLRQKLTQYPGEPDRALMEHFRTQFQENGMEFDGVFPEDLPPSRPESV